MKILILRFSALGDIALTVPVIASLAKQYPEDEFYIVSRPFVAPLFVGLGENVKFQGVDLSTYRGIYGLLRLARYLQVTTKATAVADLHDVLRTKILRTVLRFYGCKIAVIDKGRDEKRRLISGKERHPLKHVTERYAKVFERLGYSIDLDFQRLVLPPLLEQASDEKWVGIAPFAAHVGKIYPTTQLFEVVQELLKCYTAIHIYIFGSQREMKSLRTSWVHPHIHFVCDYAKGLDEELRLMSQLCVMLSMDSANLHLASLVAIPVVSIWGATHPYAGFTGYGQKENTILQSELDCRPCSIFGNKPCRFGDLRCLTQITPTNIVQTLECYL